MTALVNESMSAFSFSKVLLVSCKAPWEEMASTSTHLLFNTCIKKRLIKTKKRRRKESFKINVRIIAKVITRI